MTNPGRLFMLRRVAEFRYPILLFVAGVGLTVAAFLAGPPEPALTTTTGPGPAAPDRPTPTYPGVREPPAVPAAAAARLSDREPVVGVVVRGKARAYRLRAMRGRPEHHVVNDLVDGVPITATYCDLGECVRVFTGPGSGPLDLAVGGHRDGALILKAGGRSFDQATGRPVDGTGGEGPGLTPAEFERTTWGEWRAAHPETDVYVDPPAQYVSGSPTGPPAAPVKDDVPPG